MRSARAILSVRFTAAGGPTSVQRAVGGFLRYIQQRDHHSVLERARGIEGFLRYAAHRDRTKPQGRLFGRDTDAGERERRELGRFVTRSVHGRNAGRAYYRFVISPEDARGLDLRQITRGVMSQLERDAGTGGLPPWIAAEHRNTAHPHVHVVMAANRLLPDGRFRTLVINRERLGRMKIAMSREIYRERGWERAQDDRLLGRAAADRSVEQSQGLSLAGQGSDALPGSSRRHGLSLSVGLNFRAVARRLSERYKRELEHELELLQLRERQRGPGRELEGGRY